MSSPSGKNDAQRVSTWWLSPMYSASQLSMRVWRTRS